MVTSDTVQEVTTVANETPHQVITKTTREVEPVVKSEAPQKVYDKKKSIFRINQVIWYILGFIEVLLIFRIILKILGANPSSGFTNLIYSITTPLATPFMGILGTSIMGSLILEWSTIVAAIVYFCIALGIVYLLDLIYPISPEDVETTK